MDKLRLTGKVNSSGKPLFSGIEQWNEFFSRFPDKVFICEITVLEPYTEEHIVWFYVKVVLPSIRDRYAILGEIKTISEIDEFLREETRILFRDEEKDYKQIFDFDRWEPIHECTLEELVIYIELIIKYTAEKLGLIISKEL